MHPLLMKADWERVEDISPELFLTMTWDIQQRIISKYPKNWMASDVLGTPVL